MWNHRRRLIVSSGLLAGAVLAGAIARPRAAAGIKGGQAIGATDEIGMKAIDTPCHVHDVHATILHLLGLNHKQLTYAHNGRDERPTIVGGRVITNALA